jgi:glycine oxidase
VNPDVIVIGGGAIGAACARELGHAGRSVLVIERGGEAGEGWRAAAGMLAPQIEAHADDPLFELGLAGRERYAQLAGPLRDATGIDIGFWQEGIARVATAEPEVDELRARVAWQRQQGHTCDWLDADEVAARWPWLGPTLGALWAPHEGALDPHRLVEALLTDARRRGARVVTDEAVALERSGAQVTAVVGRSGERYQAGQYVLAAGAWSGRVGGLPRPLSVEPIRGQMAALPWPADVPPAIVFHRLSYLVARGGEALIGSTMEYAGFDVDVTPDGLSSVLANASVLFPNLQRGAVSRTWAGLRPGTPDGRPIIGRAPTTENLWYATGHGRNGILLAALTGDIVRSMLDGEPTETDLGPVAPGRFWAW